MGTMGGSEQRSGPLALDPALTNLWKLVTDIFLDNMENYPPGEQLDKYMGRIDEITGWLDQLTPDMQAVVDKIFPYMETAQGWLENTIGTLTDLYKSVEEPIQYNRNIISEAGDYWLNAEKEYEGIKAQMPTVGFMGSTPAGGSSNINMQSFPANAANRLNTQFGTAAGIGQNAVNSMGSLMGLQNTIAGTGLGAIGQYQGGAESMANLMSAPINLAAQLAPLQSQLAATQYQTPLNWMDFVKQIQLGRYGTAVQSSNTDPNFMPSLGFSIPLFGA